ncbi:MULTISPECIES: sensor histidine kinase [unclassified Romboutsia]|uniref:sensor histidine kinase n=1 Tax=unclassified Romboutsia TaxID=2626894 RepID=UPI00082143A7|nr:MULTISPECIES: GHKL domain-containing protein [unclassified Romboutsia]SCH00296.1 Sensor histidine kinase DcuS [uncultured Clostridium sp.]
MYNVFIFTVGLLVFFILFSLILYRYNFYNEMNLGKRNIFTLFISSLSFLIVYKMFTYTLYRLNENLLIKGIFTSILAFTVMIICLCIGYKFTKIININYEYKSELNKLNNKVEHKDNIISKLRSQKHDYLKHLQVVYSLLNNNLNIDAKDYIINISNSFRSKTSRYGKVSYLDAIASLKYEECLTKNITFDVYIQDFIDNLIIEPSDMSSVLLNIIDNAIDSLSTIKKDNKYIKLFVYEDEFQYVISIKNNGPKIYNTESIFEEGFSTKDGNNRGYGLYLVKNILNKYGYHIFASSDEFLTEFTILIPKYC